VSAEGNGLRRGDWALVTGASEGIGREFCRQLAVRGVNLVAVARDRDRLDALGEQLQDEYAVECRSVAADLGTADGPTAVREAVDAFGISIQLLCNNAGTGYRGAFEELSSDDCDRMIELNARSVVSMCRLFLPDLLSHPRSFVINVSSQAAYNPIPHMAVYAATKAFAHSFSQSLYGEFSERGLVVQTLVPGPTVTDFDAKAGASDVAGIRRGGVDEVVQVALAGLESGHPVISNARGLLRQRLFAALAPPRLVIRTVEKMFRPRGE
jgi:short-subunit dehydrogenase